MEERISSPWVGLWDAPWFGIGVGVLIGAYGSLVSIKWLIVAGGILICVQIFRHDFCKKGLVHRILFDFGLCCVLAFALVIAWKWVPKPPEPLTAEVVQKAARDGTREGLDPSASHQPKTESDSQAAAILSEVAKTVRANTPKAATTYLVGISEPYLANMAQELGFKLVDRRRMWWTKDGSISDAATMRIAQAKTDQERETIKGDISMERAKNRVQYEKDMVALVRDADVARKAILQRLNSYPPTRAEDKEADTDFSRFSESTIDQFDGRKNGSYLLHLGRRLVP